MTDEFKIFVDRLRNGVVENISESLDPAFMDLHEKDLRFVNPITLKGTAYIAAKDLVMALDVKTTASMTCSICLGPVEVPIHLNDLVITEEVANIKSHIYDFRPAVREAILLEVPLVAECNQNNCPERKNIEKYMAAPKKEDNNETWQPFKDL